MSSGFVHLTTWISLGGGVILGSWLASKYKNWNLFFFAIALLVGWIIHVMFYDNMWFFFDRMWQLILQGGWWD